MHRTPLIKLFLVIFLLSVTTSCTRIKIIGANFPSLFANQVVNFDIQYGKEEWQKLDVFYPKPVKQDSPVIIFLYGGRWQFGSKGDYRFAADAFTEKGYVVVIPDYVKYPEGKYPQFLTDGAEAAKWTYKNIHKYYGDGKKIFIVGHSAGGYNGAMLAANKRFGVSKYIKGFAGLAGAYELHPTGKWKEELGPVFDYPKNYYNVSVTKFVHKNQPPMILLWGRDDKTVMKEQLLALQKANKKVGAKTETRVYDGIDHVNLVAALSQVRRDWAPVVNDVTEFFSKIK